MNLLQKSQRLATDSLSAQRIILLKTIPDAMRYDHEWIHADQGESLRLVFENHCRMQHNWVLCEPGSGVTMEVARAAWVLGDAAVAPLWLESMSPSTPLFARQQPWSILVNRFAWISLLLTNREIIPMCVPFPGML